VGPDVGPNVDPVCLGTFITRLPFFSELILLIKWNIVQQ